MSEDKRLNLVEHYTLMLMIGFGGTFGPMLKALFPSPEKQELPKAPGADRPKHSNRSQRKSSGRVKPRVREKK